MSAKWIIGLVILYVGMLLLEGMVEMSSPLGASEITRLTKIMAPFTPGYTDVGGSGFSWFSFDFSYIENLWQIFWFDFPYFKGGWIYVRYIFFIPISIGVIVTLVIAVVRGVGGR